jgi:hypothetical protein
MNNRDIWRSAHLLVRRHGAEAESVAAGYAKAVDEEDRKAKAMWTLIIAAIRDVQGGKSGGRRS